MKKLRLAWVIAFPLVACTASVGDGTDELGPGVTGTVGVASAGATPGSGGSTGVGPGLTAGSGGVPGGTSTQPGGVTGGSNAAGGNDAAGGNATGGGSATGGSCSTPVLPATIQTMLQNRCVTCHGPTPLPGLPSLVGYANLTAPSKSDPTKTNAQTSLARLQNAAMPMPPAPGAPATASEISALQDFIAQGYPKPTCMPGSGGSGGTDAGGGAAGMPGTGGATMMDPLSAMPTCTSNSSWTGGNRGSASMNPGMACITCHSSGEGPSFSVAGTVYPTGHEPDRCNSTVGNAGAQIVIVGADGKQLTLTPNSVGNFSSRTAVKTPYQAKVTFQGRERLMLTAQTSGDCNSCHTQNGSNKAPGRITVP